MRAFQGTFVSLAGAAVSVAAGFLPWVITGDEVLALGWETGPGRVTLAIGGLGVLGLLASVAWDRAVSGAAAVSSSLTLLGLAVWGLIDARAHAEPGVGLRLAFLGGGLVGLGALASAVREAWPVPFERRLRVAVLWRGSILRERIFAAPQRITVGTEPGVTFLVPDEAGVTGRYELLRTTEHRAVLNLPVDATGRLCLGGREDTPSAHARRAGERRLTLEGGDWGLLHAGPLSIFMQQVVPERRPLAMPLLSLDSHALASAAISAVVHVGLILATLFLWREEADVKRRLATFRALQVEVVYDEEHEELEESPQSPQAQDGTAAPGGPGDDLPEPAGALTELEALEPLKPAPAGRLGGPARPGPTTLVDVLGGARGGGGALGHVIGGAGTLEGRVASAFSGTGDAYVGRGGGGRGLALNGAGRGGAGFHGYGVIDDGAMNLALVALKPKRARAVGRVTVSDAGRTAGGCDRADIVRVVRQRASAIRACYEQRLAVEASLSGRLTARWTIGPDGRVTGAQVASATLSDTALTHCVLRTLRRMRFRPPSAGMCVIQWPFVFSS